MKRMKVEGQDGWYHCISRVVGGARMLGDREREVFRGMLAKVAEFCGVEVLTFAVMSNHFHVLVRVPKRRALSDAELVRRFRVLYGESSGPGTPEARVLELLLATGGREAEAWRGRLLARMFDVSMFIRTLKHRFTLWFNKTHQRFGTLWAERFKSVLIEGSPRALSTVAAYIDLNPVRAGLAPDPAAYRWCGYAEAMAGQSPARTGLCAVLRYAPSEWKTALKAYRFLLFGRGGVPTEGKASIDPERVRAVIEANGVVPLNEALRCRIRYFTDGVALGSAAFIEVVTGRTRRDRNRVAPEAMALRGAEEWEELTIAQRLRSAVVTR